MQQLSLPFDSTTSLSTNTAWFQEALSILNVKKEVGWTDNFGKSLRNVLLREGITPIRTLSLFSGGGGLDIAFHDAGFEIVKMIELEDKYVQTLRHNSKQGKWLENSESICIDIREFSPEPNLSVDFIIGGPPCQTFSAAGRRAAGVSGINDDRGTLFNEYVRILKELQPKGFLFENVYGIIGANGGEAWQSIQKAFREAGYHIYFRILDAADYGVPQHRERLFIIGLKEGKYLFPCPTHGSDSLDQRPYYSAADAVNGVIISATLRTGIGGKFGHLLEQIPPGLNYSFYTKEMGYPNPIFSWRSKFSDFLYKADPKTPVRTIKAQGGQYTGPFSWENRKFSIDELKRLQTIPDSYELIGKQQVCIEQIGNSVPPQLGRILAISILDLVFGVKLPFSISYLSEDKQLSFRQRKKQLTSVYFEKAKAAIEEMYQSGQFTHSDQPEYKYSKTTTRFLSTDFSWSKEENTGSTKIYLSYDLSDSSWVISASSEKENNNEHLFSIDIHPSFGHDEWVLGVTSVRLCAKEIDIKVFTALWKAFEEKLTEATGKADLVQLSGYYQYNAKISGIMNFSPNVPVNSLWRVVQCVVRCIGIANQSSPKEFAEQWGVNVEDVVSYLHSLRSMGYEVRSHNTNPQILEGQYLIPYAFPTLNPQSVQLRKYL